MASVMKTFLTFAYVSQVIAGNYVNILKGAAQLILASMETVLTEITTTHACVKMDTSDAIVIFMTLVKVTLAKREYANVYQ